MIGASMTTPFDRIDRHKADRVATADQDLLAELVRLQPLPDEDDDGWCTDAPWARLELLVALADLLGDRRLDAGIGLVLDRLPLGDPGEVCRGFRHSFEHACTPDWSRLASICVARCASERAGTRYWALHQLGILREAAALADVLARFDDPVPDVAAAAFRAAAMCVQDHPGQAGAVAAALRVVAARRPELAGAALDHLAEVAEAAGTPG